MSHDLGLAARIRDALAGRPDITARRMFGGVAVLLGGNSAARCRAARPVRR